MHISKGALYALHVLGELSRVEGGPLTPEAVSRAVAPRAYLAVSYLRQVMRRLAQAGVLRSTRGGAGGYSLDRPLEQVSLLEVVEAIDGRLGARLEACALSRSDQISDGLIRVGSQAASAARDVLATVPVCQLLEV